MNEGKHGVTSNTPKNILFGAGTIHKGLMFTAGVGDNPGSWNFAASLVGATSGGSKLSIIPEVTPIEVDGVLVKAKGLNFKTGETAKMEVNFVELTKDIIKAAAIAEAGADGEDSANYDLIVSKNDIEAGDYWDNIAFVGQTLAGRNIIAILPNALCTSGFEQEGKNKTGSIGKYTFECHADLTSALDMLPWKIYYPKE